MNENSNNSAPCADVKFCTLDEDALPNSMTAMRPIMTRIYCPADGRAKMLFSQLKKV